MSEVESEVTRSVPEMTATPKTFTEWLFFQVPQDATIPEDDIVKKFAKAHQQQIGWPIHGGSLEEFILFFAEMGIERAAVAGAKLARELVNKDFDDYLRLVRTHHSQIEAAYKSTVFALRTCWHHYQTHIVPTQSPTQQ